MQPTLDVIVSGDVPPNASELLESSRMQYALDKLSEYYDYIILDLPPVTVVADALVASKLANGMIVVVRQDSVHRHSLTSVPCQFEVITFDENVCQPVQVIGFGCFLHYERHHCRRTCQLGVKI